VTPPKIPSKNTINDKPTAWVADAIEVVGAAVSEEVGVEERDGVKERAIEAVGKVQMLLNYFYTAGMSLAFVLLLAMCVYLLNQLDVYASVAEGSIMPSGIKAWQLILYALSIHSGSVFIAKLVDWTSSGGESYYYENPLLLKNHNDLQSDLRNLSNADAVRRVRWHTKRFYIFYFVSVGICVTILILNKLTAAV
jgi:hypothetical protein